MLEIGNHGHTTPLKQILKEKGKTGRWLARKCGVDEGGMSMVINGKYQPRLVTALKMARYLGVSAEELWGYLLEEEKLGDNNKYLTTC